METRCLPAVTSNSHTPGGEPLYGLGRSERGKVPTDREQNTVRVIGLILAVQCQDQAVIMKKKKGAKICPKMGGTRESSDSRKKHERAVVLSGWQVCPQAKVCAGIRK